jgi:hypothetical protein
MGHLDAPVGKSGPDTPLIAPPWCAQPPPGARSSMIANDS